MFSFNFAARRGCLAAAAARPAAGAEAVIAPVAAEPAAAPIPALAMIALLVAVFSAAVSDAALAVNILPAAPTAVKVAAPGANTAPVTAPTATAPNGVV